MNVSVCRLPFTKPEILPDLKRFTAEEMASSSSLVAIMSISLRDQPIEFAAFSIASRSPTKIGLTSLNLWAFRAVSRTVELVARTKINSFGLSLDAFLIRAS